MTSAATGLLPLLLCPISPPLTSHLTFSNCKRSRTPKISSLFWGNQLHMGSKKNTKLFFFPLLNAEGKCCTAQGYQQGSHEQQMLLVINKHQLDFQGYRTIKGNLKGRKKPALNPKSVRRTEAGSDALKLLMVVVLLKSKQGV